MGNTRWSTTAHRVRPTDCLYSTRCVKCSARRGITNAKELEIPTVDGTPRSAIIGTCEDCSGYVTILVKGLDNPTDK